MHATGIVWAEWAVLIYGFLFFFLHSVYLFSMQKSIRALWHNVEKHLMRSRKCCALSFFLSICLYAWSDWFAIFRLVVNLVKLTPESIVTVIFSYLDGISQDCLGFGDSMLLLYVSEKFAGFCLLQFLVYYALTRVH